MCLERIFSDACFVWCQITSKNPKLSRQEFSSPTWVILRWIRQINIWLLSQTSQWVYLFDVWHLWSPYRRNLCDAFTMCCFWEKLQKSYNNWCGRSRFYVFGLKNFSVFDIITHLHTLLKIYFWSMHFISLKKEVRLTSRKIWELKWKILLFKLLCLSYLFSWLFCRRCAH